MADQKKPDLSEIRPELAESIERHRLTLDEARPEAVQKRHARNQRTVRENITDLLDPAGSIEYEALALAAQRQRVPMDELIRKTPADGLVVEVGSVNGHLFEASKSRCMAIGYDYTVLAGTQGFFNHRKKDRMLQLAYKWRIPVVLFAEGGGGRPGDVDMSDVVVAGLDLMSFTYFARLSGLVPVVGIVSGRCFAGNAALLGCCDVIIATKDSNIGMAGPAMIEGGGLGIFAPEEVGPVSIQSPNGVIDIIAEDDADAVAKAKQYLSYFQGALPNWDCTDQRHLRQLVPGNRRRAYDVRKIIDTMADRDSVLELRSEFGKGIITALVRIEGKPFGLMANNTFHLAGAIDSDGADKASRFVQLCDAFDLPLIVLIDTPGFMVGPEAEKTAQVRHFGRIFLNAANANIPIFSIALRRGYGLGAMAMAGGSFHNSDFTVSWPTGEFGGMGLEGAVRLGFKKELEAIEDPEEREAKFEELLGFLYERGKAVNMAACLEIDDVIDPAQTRHWIMCGLRSQPEPQQRTTKKRPNIDGW